ncbi:MAG TPA: DUF4123 domain-containing protein [Puia sp.]|nr:DUF4123 domain-containing protein [Puia sp.]
MSSPLNFMLLDGARLHEALDEAMEINKSGQSLFIGKSQQKLSSVAPHLFSLEESGDTVNWFWLYGWGNAWGMLFSSERSPEECVRHFRRFLIVKTEEGKELYFRFYDPRVLRIFLPTCDKNQVLEFFGPVDYFLVEDEDKEYAIQFSHQNGTLKQHRFKAADIFSELTATLN